jgi:diguanylate cyclase (GGDEF)-like protein
VINPDQIIADDDLEKQELFKETELGIITPLIRDCPVQKVKKDEILIKAGDHNNNLYLILDGKFRVILNPDDTDPVAILEKGQSIGEISIIDHQPTSAEVVADADSRVLVLDENILWFLVNQSHTVAYNLLAVLAQRMRYGNSVINTIKSLLIEYEHTSTVDPLTGLYNRRWLEDMMTRIMQRCTTSILPLSVFMIDIDFFKQYNDKHGHIAGDEALRTISRSILQSLRPEDMVARDGGEELFALLPRIDLDIARQVAERIRNNVCQTEIKLSDGAILPSLTISIGIAKMTEEDNPVDLINSADNALYRAKHAGRNRVCE